MSRLSPPLSERNETALQRCDRHLAELLHHRILFRCGDKEHIVRMANRYAIAGLVCVALAMVGAMVFIADVVLGRPEAGVVGAVAAMTSLWCWYLQPLRRRYALHRSAQPHPARAHQLSASRRVRRAPRGVAHRV